MHLSEDLAILARRKRAASGVLYDAGVRFCMILLMSLCDSTISCIVLAKLFVYD